MRILFYTIINFCLSGMLSAFQSADLKVISFSRNDEIRQVVPSTNYIAARVQNSNTRYKAILYDKKGNEIFQKSRSDRSVIHFTAVVESKNLFIIVYMGFDNNLDVIEAYHIKTGDLEWSSTSRAGSYAISNDEQHMIPTKEPDDSGYFKLEVIDLKDGSKKHVNTKHRGIPAAWLDNDKIIYAVREYNANDNYENHELVKLDNELKRLQKGKGEIRKEFNDGKISIGHKKEKFLLVNEAMREINKRKKEYKKTHFMDVPQREIESSFKLVVYNLSTESIEQEKIITDQNGKNLLFKETSFISSKNETVQIFCQSSDREEELAIGLDKSLNDKYKISLGKVGINNKISATDRQYVGLYSYDENNNYVLDIETGKKLTLVELKNEQPGIGDFNFNETLFQSHIIDNQIQINNTSISIIDEN